MRKTIFIFLIFIGGLMSTAVSQPDSDYFSDNWTAGTANVLPHGRMEIGLFQPLQYGLNDQMELSAHPLLFFIMPNMKLKWYHRDIRGFILSSSHSFSYPTFLLRTIAREGTAGIISPEFDIPQLFSFCNEIIMSKSISQQIRLTGHAGISVALKSDKLDERTTIDLPLIYPRMTVFYNDVSLRTGANIITALSNRWRFATDVDFFMAPGYNENFAFENKGLILWDKSDHFRVCFGYKLSYAEYPFGTQWHLLLPIFDLQWGFQIK